MYVLPLALMIYAIVDCAADDEVERTSVPKPLWIIIIILFPYVGALAWLAVAKIARPRADGRGGWGSVGTRPFRPRGPAPKAPDDDQQFLREWAADQARKERERRRREIADKEEGGGSGSEKGS
jgi:hypothetical protein